MWNTSYLRQIKISDYWQAVGSQCRTPVGVAVGGLGKRTLLAGQVAIFGPTRRNTAARATSKKTIPAISRTPSFKLLPLYTNELTTPAM